MSRSAPPKRAAWYRYTDAASVGIEIVVAITLCTLVAMWIERRFTHWSPWTTLIGLVFGLAAAVNAVVRTSRNFHRSLAAEKQAAAGAEDRHDG
jgi:F0F1-type ATP synthase assembly protein I